MRRDEMMDQARLQLQSVVGDLPQPEQKALTALVFGIVTAARGRLSGAVAAIPGAAATPSKRRRVARLLANPRFSLPRAHRRLIAHVTRHGGRLDLLVDATTTGATARFPGVVTLMVAAGWHSRAVPLIWRCWRADEPDQDWAGALTQMFAEIAAALPPTAHVVVLADRGLSGGPLARACQTRGWHFLLRVIKTTRVQSAAGTIATLAQRLGPRRTKLRLTGVRLYAPRRKTDRWISDWDQALPLNVVGAAGRGRDDWWLVTDLPATLRRCGEYRHRTWEEALFRDLKSFGWGWERSRLRDPARVARLLLALALATLAVLAVAQRVVKRGRRWLVDERSRRTLSYFQIGLAWIGRQLVLDQPVSLWFTFWREVRPFPKLS
jgi:hypothetical protein